MKRIEHNSPIEKINHAHILSLSLMTQYKDSDDCTYHDSVERLADMYISTLRSHIQAMGGELNIIAKFPEGEVKITNFSDLDATNGTNTHASSSEDDALA